MYIRFRNDDITKLPLLVIKLWNTQPNKTTNQNSLKSPKLLNQRIGKRYYKILGTCVINNPLSPPNMLSIQHLFMLQMNKTLECEGFMVFKYFDFLQAGSRNKFYIN